MKQGANTNKKAKTNKEEDTEQESKDQVYKSNKGKKVLGRGLAALIEEADEGNEEAEKNLNSSINEIPLEFIQVNTYQPRDHFDEEALNELAGSIKVQGIIQPITVRKIGTNNFQIISGERRVRAAKIASLETIPAYIRTADDQQMLEMALIENIQRENLNSIEIALSYQRLLTECKINQENLGERVGKNRTTINNYLRLLKLPPDIQNGVKESKISFGHARAIINIENADAQLSVYHKILNEGLSVRKTEELVRTVNTPDKQKKESAGEQRNEKQELSPEMDKAVKQLRSHFGTKVDLKSNKNNKGEIKIPFNSMNELNRILEILDIQI